MRMRAGGGSSGGERGRSDEESFLDELRAFTMARGVEDRASENVRGRSKHPFEVCSTYTNTQREHQACPFHLTSALSLFSLFKVDEAGLAHLEGMGFHQTRCREALIRYGNDISLALESLLE